MSFLLRTGCIYCVTGFAQKQTPNIRNKNKKMFYHSYTYSESLNNIKMNRLNDMSQTTANVYGPLPSVRPSDFT